jgi:alpha-beta hydrolase superfamily lysophospholipase
MDQSYFQASDGLYIARYSWEVRRPQAALIILHGALEYGLRYDWFAQFLNSKQISVFSQDHRGHGLTEQRNMQSGTEFKTGDFGGKDGWFNISQDIKRLVKDTRDAVPGVPLFLFGHSMGSILLRDFIIQNSHLIDAAVMTGPMGPPDPVKFAAVALLSSLQCTFLGSSFRSRLLDALVMKSFNKSFSPARTPVDWLSRVEEVADEYLDNPLCGGLFTSCSYFQQLQAVKRTNSKAAVTEVRKDLPMLILGGSMDAVAPFELGLERVADLYRAGGLEHVDLKVYPDARHELVNEINREEVAEDIYSFLKSL